ncbi:GNAT family N-acetyltransferase [Nocardioides sp. zg-1228]|uniref:GNAT family N-acetyltransferase n=1 Tax=Nocardioides sp. zg-1228 TaxID=2763008 RepID=UPI00164249D8|nr:GNAT family N-acetyltransferase [Nocardioides sp. zg-1228]MBC2934423.1 GNAT family N-acetyltransferase [Nocardioides sp. zg-1228]QSF59188.1 GNAT family N-acetyltransferase [Nocardioides sp. zg-1228]
MSRTAVVVRAADPSDAPSLRELWCDILRKGRPDEQLADVTSIVSTACASDERCVVVAEIDGEVAGAVYLEAATFTPLNLEPAVLAVSPHVFAQFRRRGVGSALMEAACRFAEEHGISHVQTAAAAEARDANRFMARLSLAPQATLRAATTGALRARLPQGRQASPAASSRQRIDRVLAARRVRRERVPG